LSVRANTIFTANSTSVTLDAGAASADNFYKDATITITTGPANGSYALITSYDGGTRVANFVSWSGSVPSVGASYSITKPELIDIDSRIIAYVGSTKVATLQDPYPSQFLPAANNNYVLVRSGVKDSGSVITAYNGTTKVATLQYPFQFLPESGRKYTIGVNGNTIGSDQMEYGIEALYDTGYNLAAIKTAYETICSWPNADTGTFGSAYDSRICWTPFFRPYAGLYNSASKAYGAFYDVQGVGPLLKFKKDHYPIHYAVSLQKALTIPEIATFVDKDWETSWDTDYSEQFEFTTVGIGTVKGAVGLGILETL
jgi:hypothetical protein